MSGKYPICLAFSDELTQSLLDSGFNL